MRFFLSFLVLSSTACIAVSPSPMTGFHAQVTPQERNTVTVSGYAQYLSGVLMPESLGGEARVEWQIVDRISLGVGFGGMMTPWGRFHFVKSESDPSQIGVIKPIWWMAGRFFGRWNPSTIDWMALTWGGGGGGLNIGAAYLTADIGLLFGSDARKAVDVYGGPMLAGSIPITKADPWQFNSWTTVVERWLPATAYGAGILGMGVRLLGPLRMTFEVSAGGLVTTWGAATFNWTGSVGMRYAIGP